MILEIEPRCLNCKHQQMINDSGHDTEVIVMTCHFCGDRYKLAVIPIEKFDEVKEMLK